MDRYENDDNFKERVHTIRVTFQFLQYKGHIAFEIRGNCQGLNLLDFSLDCFGSDDIKHLTENDCQLYYDEDCNIFKIVLSDSHGNTCDLMDEPEELADKVVAIEIVDCKIIKTKF